MKKFLQAALLLTVVGLLSSASTASAQYVPPVNNRVDLNFNYDWKFIKSDVTGASAANFDDSAWMPVSLPHTWNDDKYREWCNSNNVAAADPLEPKGTYYGIGWYRKHFTLEASYTGRKVILEFQGIGRCAHFFVNGKDLGYHENGIGPCGLDVTAALNPAGTDNVIAVWVTNDFNYVTQEYGTVLPYGQPFNVNYGGLNRDAILHVADPLYQTLPLYRNLGTQGIYIYPTNIDTLAQTAGVTVQAEVKNDYTVSKTATLDAVIVDAAGNAVGTTFSASAQTVAAGQLATFNATTNVSGVHFWSPDYPYIYQVYTILKVGGVVVDVVRTPLGVRKYKFGSTIGLECNGHPLYLNGYAPRSTMEWPDVGMPPDWMVDFAFALIKASNGNFLRPMHGAPRRVQVDAADRYGVVMTVPAVATENDEPVEANWVQKLADMRDVTIYYRNNPSVLFYEGCNGDLSAQHMTDMLNVRLAWDPNGGRLTGTRSSGPGSDAYGIREYGSPMDGVDYDTAVPIWDAEYGRGEAPRHVWDNDTPMLNPRWDGKNADPTPAAGTVGDTTHKYLTGGYFYVASDFHQGLGLDRTDGNCIDDYLAVIPDGTGYTNGYFRLQNSEDMVLENLAKYYARFERSVFVQPPATSAAKGVMVGGAKIIWADSVTDGRMVNMEVARVSGAVDGARLPKEVFYGMQVAQNPNPQVYIVGHWNYAPGFVKKELYVVGNTSQVKLQAFDTKGNLVKDYGFGTTSFFPASILPVGGDQVNHYVFRFDNVAWQAGSLVASGYNDGSAAAAATHTKSTAGAPASVRITPITNPAGWQADGEDVAMFDVEVVDANGQRCPTYEDAVTFDCSGTPTTGVFLGGYNGGARYSTNYAHLLSGYKLNVEAGVNRVFVRSTRTAGAFTLSASASGLASGSATVTSAAFPVTNGLTNAWPARYTVPPLGVEPAPVAEGTAPPPPANSPNPAPATDVTGFVYSGAHQGKAEVVENIQPGALAYEDSTTITLPSTLPGYLVGTEFIRPFQGDAQEQSSTDQYQMYLARYSYVYQVVDAANGMPAHDNNAQYGWTKLADQITVNGRAMNIYKSALLSPDAEVYLASNGHNNAAPGFDPDSNMYLLFIASAELDLQNPADAIAASTTQGTYVAANAIDGNTATHWNAASGTMPQTLTLTLAQPCSVGGYMVNWQSGDTRVYTYQIDVSADGTTWTKSLDMTGNANTGTNEYRVPAALVPESAGVKYVRLTVLSAGGGGWAAVNEWRVRGVVSGANSATAVPTITSALTASGNGGYAFSYQITASNAPTGFDAQGLPAGLTVNNLTGVISGSTLQSGVIPITVSAINGAGTGSATVNVTMAAPPPVPVVNSALTYSTQAGIAIATPYTITATNMSYTPSSYAATLPSGLGLSYSTSTGKITGTPKYPGTYTIPINGVNPGGAGPVANLQFTVTANGTPPSVTSAGNVTGYLGTALSYPITGSGSPTLFGASGLPAGLSVNTSTGVVSGTPTALGTYPATVTAANAGGTGSETVTFAITRNPNAPVITSALTAAGHAGSAFSYAVVATNTPTSYSATPLPAGLTFSTTTGVLSGTPTAQATTSVTIKASNASGYDAETLTVTIAAKVTAPVVNSPVNAVGSVGAPFAYQVTAANAPTSFAATPLPAGLTFDTGTGWVTGTPLTAASTTISLTASNDGGTSAARTLTLLISPAGADINLALNKNVATLDAPIDGNVAAYAVDGIPGTTGTRWESPHSDAEWIMVDLGAVYTIHAVNLDWENACGANYQIQVSSDGQTWTNFVSPVTGNKTAGWLDYNGNTSAEFVRMNGSLRATQYGYSLYELQVMGPASNVAAPGGLAAAPGSEAGQIAVSWQAVSGAQSYLLQRSGTGATSGFVTIGSVTAPGAAYTDADAALLAGVTYSYRVAAVTAQGTSAWSAAVTGTPNVPPGIAGWRYLYFGAAGLNPTDANGASDGANPARDGISNLMKYALGLNPTLNDYAAGMGGRGLPTVQRVAMGGAQYLALTFTGAAADVTYQVQATGALGGGGAWTTLATYGGAGAVGTTFTVQDSVPVGAGAGARFMRLQVTGP